MGKMPSSGRWRLILLLALLLVLLAVWMLSLALGSVSIPLDQIVDILLGREADRAAWTNILLKFRLPKAMTALLAGMALGVSGLLMQTFFRNPLAGPFVLGVSSGASLGVALIVLSTAGAAWQFAGHVGLGGDLLLSLAAGLGAGMTMLLVLLVAARVQSSMTLLILGLMFGYLVSALVSLLLYFAVPERIQAYVNWTFGTFGGVTGDQLPILGGMVSGGLLLAAGLAKSLNALLLGESYARSLGIRLWGLRLGIVLAASLLAGAVTAFCGPIAFIGIAAPHLCRALFRSSDHRLLLPATMAVGAVVALLAALLAELPGRSLVLPLNAVTALLGAPVVIVLILQRRHAERSYPR